MEFVVEWNEGSQKHCDTLKQAKAFAARKSAATFDELFYVVAFDGAGESVGHISYYNGYQSEKAGCFDNGAA